MMISAQNLLLILSNYSDSTSVWALCDFSTRFTILINLSTLFQYLMNTYIRALIMAFLYIN